ncbi:NUDIX domain-containing protein [Pelagibacterium halotolerans]|uniref:MutT/nudix family protein n=1 Tax=Pelagibacterium halotolerans (strain DSM 22347 / JCM 15775 / CGMCC 1.7692 / B2) TaxID=1082931 RepID=G4RBV4_PELHB|nr:NUDIX domain-containing protein [Pelagibacterium halotolerans]AEQ50617.1 MutT/nudix family protein [Pelagibacterium halotolerans B2]QJR19443.1 NUDIX domain-containing protein [Pelagibacterium halotolerans]SDZ91180.1 ADP-ribose pyrophosphatase YjhB, NUDIX family [Pelagibacterium halotolerans]
MKPDACSIGLFNGDQVLLIQRAYAPFLGQWTFPGGRMEPGETPLDCVKRELFEETRLLISDPIQVLVETVGEGAKSYTLAVFAAHCPMGAPVTSHEISDWDWVHVDEVQSYRTTDHLAEIVHTCAQYLGLAEVER